MAVSFVVDAAAASNVRALSFALGTLAVGDIIVIPVMTEDTSQPEAATPGGATGITWTAKQTQATASKCYQKLWTGVVTAAGSKTVTVAGPSTSDLHGGVAGVFPAADGYSLAGSPALVGGASTPVNGAASATPTATITTVGASGSIVFWALGDWAARDGAGRTYQSSATDRGYVRLAANATLYWATQITTGAGSKTVGISGGIVGGTTTPSIVGVEILFTSPNATEFEGWGVSI